ncbi:MAG TPA: hypothetical protein VFX57_02095 [Sulfuricurvum sp.]|nr:hypothetical protein [Sulfuricurvum sp.]
MKKILILLLLLTQTAFAEPSVLTEGEPAAPQATEPMAVPETEADTGIDSLFSNAAVTEEGAVTLEQVKTPSHLYIGEIFPVTIKLTPTDVASGNIEYTLQNEEGVRVFSSTPRREVKEDGVYDTFYFLTQTNDIRLPDITANVTSNGSVSNVLYGTRISASALTPPATFANVLADSFKVIDYKTTAYNQESNIVVFSIKASRCNIGTFTLPNAIKQGFESKIPNVEESQVTYYAIIPNTQTTLDFTIFNLRKNRYESISIPIVVDDDAVSTQSDLSPTDSRHTELKVGAAAILGVILIAMYYWRRKQWYLIASVVPFFFVVFTLLPNSTVCVKKGAPLYLLPINNGTIFEMTLQEEHLEAENEVGDFIKVRLENKQVGWVNQRDLCSN